MAKTWTERVPLHIIDPTAEDGEIIIRFEWNAGFPETGRYSGPPENYDPGSADEFYIEGAAYDVAPGIPVGLAEHEREKIIEWLDENWERPDDGPDPDDARDRMLDDQRIGK